MYSHSTLKVSSRSTSHSTSHSTWGRRLWPLKSNGKTGVKLHSTWYVSFFFLYVLFFVLFLLLFFIFPCFFFLIKCLFSSYKSDVFKPIMIYILLCKGSIVDRVMMPTWLQLASQKSTKIHEPSRPRALPILASFVDRFRLLYTLGSIMTIWKYVSVS